VSHHKNSATCNKASIYWDHAMTGTRLLTIIVPSSVFCHRISHHHYEEFSVRDACLLWIKCDIVCDIIAVMWIQFVMSSSCFWWAHQSPWNPNELMARWRTQRLFASAPSCDAVCCYWCVMIAVAASVWLSVANIMLPLN
jgi:hypothetical protein